MGVTYLDGNRLFVDPDAMVGLRSVVSGTADVTIAGEAEAFGVYFSTKGSATQTYTLPAATTAGRQYTFVCNNASTEILINPVTGEKIRGMVIATVGADADTAAINNTTTGIKNTAATNVVGDSITLISDGVDTWHILNCQGIWATQ